MSTTASPSGGAAAATVNTAKVKGRRVLKFESVAAMMADVDRIVAAERAGTLKRLGNWTVGQNLGHLATWINFAFDGYPPDLQHPPLWIKLLLRLMKRKFLNGGLPSGARIPKIEGGTKGTEVMSTDEGLNRFRAAWARLNANAPAIPNPIFGKMTHDEWKRMHLSHAGLHLSFLVP